MTRQATIGVPTYSSSAPARPSDWPGSLPSLGPTGSEAKAGAAISSVVSVIDTAAEKATAAARLAVRVCMRDTLANGRHASGRGLPQRVVVNAEERTPTRVEPLRPDDAPRSARRGGGRAAQSPPELGDPAVGFHVVAAAAGGHDVLPRVGSAATARDDVVQARRRGAAVLA